MGDNRFVAGERVKGKNVDDFVGLFCKFGTGTIFA